MTTHHENAAHAAKIAAARATLDRAAATQRKLAAIERVTGVEHEVEHNDIPRHEPTDELIAAHTKRIAACRKM